MLYHTVPGNPPQHVVQRTRAAHRPAPGSPTTEPHPTRSRMYGQTRHHAIGKVAQNVTYSAAWLSCKSIFAVVCRISSSTAARRSCGSPPYSRAHAASTIDQPARWILTSCCSGLTLKPRRLPLAALGGQPTTLINPHSHLHLPPPPVPRYPLPVIRYPLPVTRHRPATPTIPTCRCPMPSSAST